MGAVLVVLTLMQLGVGRSRRQEGRPGMSARRAIHTPPTRRQVAGTGPISSTWIWLIGGLFIMFGPAVWLVGSSFKSPAALAEFPPTILPYVTQKVTVEGQTRPLPLYDVTLDDGIERRAGRGAAHRHRRPDDRPEGSRRHHQGPHQEPQRRPQNGLRDRATTRNPSCISTSSAISAIRSSSP